MTHLDVGTRRSIDAVVFDFGGVITTSPFEHMARIGTGADPDAVLELLIGPYHDDTDHPWHRAERGEIDIFTWITEVTAAGAEAGVTFDFGAMRGALGVVHDEVVDRIARLRVEGYRTALLTNNVREAAASWRAMVDCDALFDVVVDSSAEGVRKPDPRIYRLTLDRLGVDDPARAVFLDDHEGNVAGAARAGLRTILVADPAAAIAELDALLAG
ncbi:MAG TPA: HAD family phosphatase [Acidimicrobiales bacterium]|nr:HAD family phosphatase [Acidimicrobiales bacterium]